MGVILKFQNPAGRDVFRFPNRRVVVKFFPIVFENQIFDLFVKSRSGIRRANGELGGVGIEFFRVINGLENSFFRVFRQTDDIKGGNSDAFFLGNSR